MKTKLFTIILFLAVIWQSFGQLSEGAVYLKENQTEIYSEIREAAVSKWTKGGSTNHEMVVYTINNQVEAFFTVAKIMSEIDENSEENKILSAAILKWTKNGFTNYEMVLYTYNNQIENLGY